MTDQQTSEEWRDAALTSFAQRLSEIEGGTEALNLIAAGYTTQLTIEEVSAFLLRLRKVVTTLRVIDAAYERWIATIFEDQGWPTGHDHPHPVEGVGAVEVSRSKTEKWESEAVVKAWLERWMSTRGAEVPEPWDLIHALAKILGLIKQDGTYAAATFRKTPLKELGLNPKDYLSTEYGAARVTITEETASDA